MYPIYKSIGTKEKCKTVKIQFPPQEQNCQPGIEHIMMPRPISNNPEYMGSGKLKNKVAIITGGDSGIGRAVAYAFAKEGANIVISYLNEDKDAMETKACVESLGVGCILVPGDLTDENMSTTVVNKALECFGKIDILVNNHAVQFVQNSIMDITYEQMDLTFKTNIYSYIFMIKAVLPYLKKGSSIINTTSITAYQGEPLLIDYSATKGAIVALTRSLSQSLMKDGIRVNGVAPGPIWTPLIPASFSAEQIQTFGSGPSEVPMNRAGQPFEMAPSYVFLASDDSRYMSGQVLHPNGGVVVGS